MLSMTHMIIVFIVVLVVFGPQKLPELARGLGKLMAEFRKASADFRNAFEHEMRDLERQALQAERKKAEATNVSANITQSTTAPASPAGAEPSTATPEASGTANEGPVVTSVAESVPRSYEESSPVVSEAEPVSAEPSVDPTHDHKQPA